MKMSGKRKMALYVAFGKEIIKLRLDLNAHKVKDLDGRLHRLELDIWENIQKVLNLEGPA